MENQPLSVREQFLTRKEARDVLLDFLFRTGLLNENDRDFQDAHSEDFARQDPYLQESQPKPSKHLKHYVQAKLTRSRPTLSQEKVKGPFLELLRLVAKGQAPTQEQLDLLLAALNQPLWVITFSPSSRNRH